MMTTAKVTEGRFRPKRRSCVVDEAAFVAEWMTTAAICNPQGLHSQHTNTRAKRLHSKLCSTRGSLKSPKLRGANHEMKAPFGRIGARALHTALSMVESVPPPASQPDKETPPDTEALTTVSLEAAATLEMIARSIGNTADDSRLIVGTVFTVVLMLLCACIILAAVRFRSKRRSYEATPIMASPTKPLKPSRNHGTFERTPTACQATFEPQDPEWAAARAKWHAALLASGALAGDPPPHVETDLRLTYG
jgi:hypothetical protein